MISRLLEALSDTFPSTSHNVHRDLPSLLTFSPVPVDLFQPLLDLPKDRLMTRLADSAFVSTDSTSWARLFDTGEPEDEDQYRKSQRLRAEMMLLASGQAEVVDINQLRSTHANGKSAGATLPVSSGLAVSSQQSESTVFTGVSPAYSMGSLSQGEGDSPSDEDDMAQTPPLGESIEMPQQAIGEGALGMDLGLAKKPAVMSSRAMSEEAM